MSAQGIKADDEKSSQLRSSGYVSRLEEYWYGISHPFYDLMIWFVFLPLGGEAACRRQFARWVDVQPEEKLLSLCCGTGDTEIALFNLVPTVQIIAVDLGAGQISTAKQKDKSGSIDFCVGNAAQTGLAANSFDRVLITLALHEMPYSLRLKVLREARRVCKPNGRVVAIEHAKLDGKLSQAVRYLWWFGWLPGNPEVATSRDLQQRGLATEMREAGLEALERYTTDPSWIEGVVSAPNS
ncbi:MAG: class I SAM-dependent methyltransferase [Anaerolineae bacterium]|nr:class I SAM-dependent methyltransferase [Anaerolineae bacterium]